MIKNFIKWSLSEETKSELKDLQVIDFHSHIWNILERNPKQIFEKNPDFPVDIRTIGANFWKFKHPSKFMKKVLEIWPIKNYIIETWKRRNKAANLYTFKESMEESAIANAVCLPIEPFQTFDDLLLAKEVNEKIIPFSSVDFTLFRKKDKNLILDEIERKFIDEIKRWSKWLKIHPIIQWIAPDTDEISEVIEIWTKVSNQLAILFHTWVTEYCTKNEKCNHKPEYGSIAYFEYVAKNHPQANIVIGHSGLFEVDEVIKRLYKYDNVYLDTSFQPSEKIKEIIFKFWTKKTLFASDWPYGDRIPAIKVMLNTIEELKSIFGEEKLKERILRDNAKNLMRI